MNNIVQLPKRTPTPTDKELEGRIVPGPLFLATTLCAFSPRCEKVEQPCATHLMVARMALNLCKTPEQLARSCRHEWECPICTGEIANL